jgi:hypothetical protein
MGLWKKSLRVSKGTLPEWRVPCNMNRMGAATLLAILIAAIALAIAAWSISRVQRTKQLRSKYGRDYDQMVQSEGGNKTRSIRPLSREELNRFSDTWRRAQNGFAGNPKIAVIDADKLAVEVMTTRGYPVSGHAADVPLPHLRPVENFREAHSIAELCRHDRAGIEELRRAMIHYHALFQDQLGNHVANRQRDGESR